MRTLLVHHAIAAALLVGCSGGTPKPRACRASTSCSEGEACVTGRCAASSSPAAMPIGTRRFVVEPEAIATVLSEDQDLPSASPVMAPLGASVGPRARILLKLPRPTWGSSVARAFLVLDRAEGASAGPGDVTVRAEKIVEPWSVKGGAGTTWASPPRSESIEGAEVHVGARGTSAIRIDVTPYVTEMSKKGAQTWGLRVEGRGDGFGLPIATGFGKGVGPRIEVYVP